MLRYVFLNLLFLASTLVWAQAPLSTDSLAKLLKKNSKKDTMRVLLLNQLAYSHYYNDPLRAFQEAIEARIIADSLNFSRGEADAFRQIGMSFWAQADMSTAINYFLTGLTIAQSNGHKQVEADLLSNIGTAYNGLNNPTEALTFLNRSLTIQRQLKNLWREASVLNNIGDSYTALREFDKAREAYTFALNIATLNNYPLGVTTNLRNLGNIHELNKRYDSALTSYFKCIELSTAIKDMRGVILSNKSIASVYLAQKKIELAKRHANIALNESLKVRLKAFIRDSYELMYRINEAGEDHDQAFKNFKLYTLYKDSVQNLRTVSDIAADRLRFETDRKQTEIELLKKEGEIQATRIRFQKSQILGISVSLALSIGFIIITFVNYRKMRANNVLLNKSQTEIEEKNKLLSQKSMELNALNTELISRQAQIMAQHDELIQKNKEIESMNRKVQDSNQNLEQLVHERTKVLEDQNKRLSDYSFFNAHELRSPVASILGLLNLLQSATTEEERKQLLTHLDVSAKRLDDAIRAINNHLQAGIQ